MENYMTYLFKAIEEYAQDAYKRPKVVQDYSIFNGEATIRIPLRVWEQEVFNLNVVPATVTHQDIDGTHILSEDNMFTVKSGTVANYGYSLKTKEFFRVQSNRGGIYSWSAEYPNPNAAGARAVGPSSGENGISLFMVGTGTSWTLYYNRRHNNTVAAMVDLAPYLPAGFDPAKGHLYDMRIQWRGVGNIQIFIDEELIYTEEILGTLTGLSVADNSLPFIMASSCAVNGTQVALKVGCVNISSEGGTAQPGVFGSVTTGDSAVQVDTIGTPTIAIRVPRYITYNGNTVQNTRGAIMTKAVQWLRDEGAMIAYVARDYNVPNLSALTWTTNNDSKLQHLIGGDASALNTAFQADRASCVEVVREYSEIETKNIITNPGRDDFLLTPGDILIVCAKPLANNKQCFTTLYYSEQL
jgi:hypothetical protein